MGKDGKKLPRVFTDLFGWKIDASNPMNYGMVEASKGRGIPGGVGQLGDKPWPGVAFYVSTTDIKGSLEQAGKLGGKTLIAPDRASRWDDPRLLRRPRGQRHRSRRGGGLADRDSGWAVGR